MKKIMIFFLLPKSFSLQMITGKVPPPFQNNNVFGSWSEFELKLKWSGNRNWFMTLIGKRMGFESWRRAGIKLCGSGAFSFFLGICMGMALTTTKWLEWESFIPIPVLKSNSFQPNMPPSLLLLTNGIFLVVEVEGGIYILSFFPSFKSKTSGNLWRYKPYRSSYDSVIIFFLDHWGDNRFF